MISPERMVRRNHRRAPMSAQSRKDFAFTNYGQHRGLAILRAAQLVPTSSYVLYIFIHSKLVFTANYFHNPLLLRLQLQRVHRAPFSHPFYLVQTSIWHLVAFPCHTPPQCHFCFIQSPHFPMPTPIFGPDYPPTDLHLHFPTNPPPPFWNASNVFYLAFTLFYIATFRIDWKLPFLGPEQKERWFQ